MTLEDFAPLQIEQNENFEAWFKRIETHLTRLDEIVRTQRDLINIMDEQIHELTWDKYPPDWIPNTDLRDAPKPIWETGA